jgi:saccharopine dehydrogenase (NAD+, L-lysine-forming)
MAETVKRSLGSDGGKRVRALVIGALGRCGGGAVELFRKIGLEEWVHLFLLTSWLRTLLIDCCTQR